jgi:phthalate 3,4-dioxygenase ferredoxin reductase subunit
VESVEGAAGDLRVSLTDGSELSAATVVVGIGAVPNVSWLADSGLAIDNGVLCDEYCRAVGQADVYAVGDVARWWRADYEERVRVEHWTNAAEAAACAAHNIAHPDELRSYQPVEYVWSDQYDWKVQITGRPSRAARHRVIGDLAGAGARAAVAYGDDHDRLVGVVTVNWPKASIEGRRALESKAGLADTEAKLGKLLERATAMAKAKAQVPGA